MVRSLYFLNLNVKSDMNISVDFDDTYTRDPNMWNTVIAVMQTAGHNVYCVTARTPEQGLDVYSSIGRMVGADNCYFPSLHAKKPFMWAQGIRIDVWVDDTPMAVYNHYNIGIIFP